MSDEKKCETKCGGFFKWVFIALLLLNTYFLGGIWCALTHGCMTGYGQGSFCPFSRKDSGKMCPITGKMMGGDKGSMMDPSQSQNPSTQK